MAEPTKPGPTGKFPEGKIFAEDEGELAVGLGIDKQTGTVMIYFGHAIEWIGFDGDQAIGFGKKLIEIGQEAKRRMAGIAN